MVRVHLLLPKVLFNRTRIFFVDIEPPTPTLFYLGVGDYSIVFLQSLGVGANAPRASPLASTKKSCSIEQDFFCRYRTLHERSEYKTHKSVMLITTCFYHKYQVKRLGIFYFIEPPTTTLFFILALYTKNW